MINVLIADDERVQREGIVKHIPWNQLGMCVIGCAADGIEALQIASATTLQLLITDVKMPKMNGLELAKLAKSSHSNLKIIVISGFDEFEYAKSAIEINVNAYLLKPINIDKLRLELHKVDRKSVV